MRARLNYWADRLWRLFATGFCFFVFSAGGVIQTLLVVPFIYAMPGSEEQKARRVRALQRRTFANFVWLLGAVGVIRFRVHNRELAERSAGCLVIANHPTLVDVVILYATLPKANCVVKGELWRNRYWRGVLKAAGFISNDNAEDLLAGCQRALDRGESVLIFPEGSRTVPDKGLDFKRGMAQVAVRTHVPIMTVFITCKPLTLTKQTRWYQIPPRCADIDVYFKEVLRPQQLVSSYDDKPAAARQLTSFLQDYYQKGLKAYD
ncbi:MAG TPA: lysophospholipid acyltransferase family protein [Cellvibrionaceae bacterium]